MLAQYQFDFYDEAREPVDGESFSISLRLFSSAIIAGTTLCISPIIP